jgi:hypothetical protein
MVIFIIRVIIVMVILVIKVIMDIMVVKIYKCFVRCIKNDWTVKILAKLPKSSEWVSRWNQIFYGGRGGGGNSTFDKTD